MSAPPPPQGQAGYALISAIWARGILMVLAAGMVAISGFGVGQTRAALERGQAQAFADAILAQTVLALQDARQNARPRVDGVPFAETVLGRPVTVVVWDEFGKLDLNAAPVSLFSGLFQSVGKSEAEADVLAAAVENWRAGNAGANGAPRRRIFRRTNELLRIPGITPEMFNRIAPGLTVQSGQEQPDRAVAPYETLLALPGITPAAARRMLADRTNVATSPAAMSVFVDGQVALGVDQRGWPFAITCRFRYGQGFYRLDAVIRQTGAPMPPFLVSEKHFASAQE